MASPAEEKEDNGCIICLQDISFSSEDYAKCTICKKSLHNTIECSIDGWLKEGHNTCPHCTAKNSFSFHEPNLDTEFNNIRTEFNTICTEFKAIHANDESAAAIYARFKAADDRFEAAVTRRRAPRASGVGHNSVYEDAAAAREDARTAREHAERERAERERAERERSRKAAAIRTEFDNISTEFEAIHANDKSANTRDAAANNTRFNAANTRLFKAVNVRHSDYLVYASPDADCAKALADAACIKATDKRERVDLEAAERTEAVVNSLRANEPLFAKNVCAASHKKPFKYKDTKATIHASTEEEAAAELAEAVAEAKINRRAAAAHELTSSLTTPPLQEKPKALLN